MLAIHDQFTQQMCDRLTTTCMGLGLMRLLQDAKRFDEARTTLHLLENGSCNVESDKPRQKPYKVKGVIKTASYSSGPAGTDVAEMHHALCLV